jgi:hypothetical protein
MPDFIPEDPIERAVTTTHASLASFKSRPSSALRASFSNLQGSDARAMQKSIAADAAEYKVTQQLQHAGV